jgi:hypothetical protein
VTSVTLNTLNSIFEHHWSVFPIDLCLQSLANTSDGEDLLRAELLHFKQACVAQEKRIQELESESAQGLRILPSILPPTLSAQPSLVIQNSIVSHKLAGYIDCLMVDKLRELRFLEDQARQALSQSNNNLAVTADILMKPLDNTTTRVRFDENVRPEETRLSVPVMSFSKRDNRTHRFGHGILS